MKISSSSTYIHSVFPKKTSGDLMVNLESGDHQNNTVKVFLKYSIVSGGAQRLRGNCVQTWVPEHTCQNTVISF